jgi:Protein of unknown function (DUF3179)
VWETTVNGRQLHFRLAGINNQNFIMKDEETGSWWQQVTGEAILGPLKGKQLKPVFHDELTFATWKREEPNGRVLRPDERVAAKGEYAPANWEEQMQRVRVATLLNDQSLEQRALVIGINLNGATKAYPFSALQKQNPIVDSLGGVPLVIVLNDDGRSVRAFVRGIGKEIADNKNVEFFLKPNSSPLRMVDASSGSEWDFTGTCVSGPYTGRTLQKVPVLEDYWFDWKTYNPQTTVYSLGEK